MHDMKDTIFHLFIRHDEMIIVFVLADVTSINYLTRPGACRD
jgi:hypothetical protein